MKGQHRSVGVGHGTKFSCKMYEISGMIHREDKIQPSIRLVT
jgi:hypothetical protein